jgi:hypothetical protein
MIVFSILARWVIIDGFECFDRYIDVSHGIGNRGGIRHGGSLADRTLFAPMIN